MVCGQVIEYSSVHRISQTISYLGINKSVISLANPWLDFLEGMRFVFVDICIFLTVYVHMHNRRRGRGSSARAE